MSTTTTPTFSETTVISDQVLTRGNLIRGTLDLTGAYGAWVLINIGRSDTTALTNGVQIKCERELGNDADVFPGGDVRQGSATAATRNTLNGALGSPPTTSFVLTSGTGFVADDLVCLWGTATDPTTLANAAALANLEFCQLSKVASNTLTPASPLRQTHVNAEYVTNKADAFPVWLDGGCVWGIVVDYGDDAAGNGVAVRCRAQTWTQNVTA